MPYAKRRSFIVAIILLTSPSSYGQAFEVASVKADGTDCRGKSSADSQQVRYSNFSLKGLVRDAYRVELFQITAPDWFGDQCYDVVAKLPEGATRQQVPSMLQALLVERFRMKAHFEIRQDRVYALIVGKNGPDLKASKIQSERIGGVKIGADGHLVFTSATLTSFSSAMSALMARPVVNMTDIQGHFDITLTVSREDLSGIQWPSDNASADRPVNKASLSVFAAIEELGLKLDSRRAPIQHVVIDSAARVPTGN